MCNAKGDSDIGVEGYQVLGDRARTLEAAGAPTTGERMNLLMSSNISQLVRFSSRRPCCRCLLKLPHNWELGVRRMPSCLLKNEVIEPALGDAHYKAVLGDSPDLPAGPALALQLALPAQTGQPTAIMDAESSESGEILSAGLHDGHAALVVSSVAPAVAFKRLQILPRKRARATSTCFHDGGRLIRRFFRCSW